MLWSWINIWMNEWNKLCLGVCLFVSLLVCNKRQTSWTDWAQFFYGTSHDPREGLWIIQFFKNLLPTKFDFWKFWNPQKKICFNPQKMIIFILQCLQREHVHNSKRRWARSALKAYLLHVFIIYISLWYAVFSLIINHVDYAYTII